MSLGKTLLSITAAVETGTGVALAIDPSTGALALVDLRLESPAGLIFGRILAAAILSLGVACWLARDDARGRAAMGLIRAMFVYNVAVVLILAHARLGLGLSGLALLPAVVLHTLLTAWCLACLVIDHGDRRHTESS